MPVSGVSFAPHRAGDASVATLSPPSRADGRELARHPAVRFGVPR